MNEKNDANDALLDQADALMRRRNFSASLNLAEARPSSLETPSEPDDEKTQADTSDTVDPTDEQIAAASPATPTAATHGADAQVQIPVLTNIIHASPAADTAATAILATDQGALEQTLTDWLQTNLPAAIASSLDELQAQWRTQLQEHLLTELQARARRELRERPAQLNAALTSNKPDQPG